MSFAADSQDSARERVGLMQEAPREAENTAQRLPDLDVELLPDSLFVSSEFLDPRFYLLESFGSRNRCFKLFDRLDKLLFLVDTS